MSGAPPIVHFTSPTPFEGRYPSALAVYCSDGRFTRSVEDLLAHLGYPRLDTLTIPGGAGVMNPWRSSPLEADPIDKAARFLIQSHGIRQVVLLAHADCGFYKARFPGRTAADMREAQIDDLEVASRSLRACRAGVSVELFYAVAERGVVRFESVSARGGQR